MTLDFREIRDRIVLAALPHVAFDGWSDRVLAEAARDEGLDPTLPARAFPGGAIDAVEHFIDMADRTMLIELDGLDLDAMRLTDKVFEALMLRFARWDHQREAVRRAMALLALNPMTAARATFRTVDAIWRAVGDASHDFSWYTKRATLTAVYSATVLCWLEDGSENLADTRAFLRRRLGDVGRITKTRKRLEQWTEKLPHPGRMMRAR
jgi:ubiquinone biosynthesis protein COQ9